MGHRLAQARMRLINCYGGRWLNAGRQEGDGGGVEGEIHHHSKIDYILDYTRSPGYSIWDSRQTYSSGDGEQTKVAKQSLLTMENQGRWRHEHRRRRHRRLTGFTNLHSRYDGACCSAPVYPCLCPNANQPLFTRYSKPFSISFADLWISIDKLIKWPWAWAYNM